MSVLTKNEYLLTKYFTELQINKSASENLCKELIELFDGKINVTSKKNVGTTVQFNLLLDQS